jgi:hypothetical protein
MHHVGPANESLYSRSEIGILDVGSQAPLAGLSRVKRPLDPPQLITLGRLELDHVRPKIGKQARRVRARIIGAKIEDLDAIEERPGINVAFISSDRQPCVPLG